ncbi:T9SS type A sorting domain-containing protein [candidate division KSB1 bacterium]|nr:T9SS type A sorting domain-containing protein [candidate division KSB1 bacterium]
MNQSKMDTKRDSFFVYVFILILCLAMSAFTQTGEVVSTLIPNSSQVSIGDTVSVLIQIDMTGVDVPNNNLGSFTGSVMWDSTKLVYLEDTGIGPEFTGNTNSVDINEVVFNGANPTGVTGIIDLTTFNFAVVDTGEVLIDLEYSAMAAAATFQSLLGILTVNDTTIEVLNTYTLTINVLPDLTHGTTDPAPGVYQYTEDEEVSVASIPNKRPFGARFDEWQGDASGSDSIAVVTMDADKEITAVFYLPTGVDGELEALPEKVALYQNYPNPFNPQTQINFDIPASSSVLLEIYNINGQKVRTLFNGIKPAGRYTEIWNATNDAGKNVTSGVYLLRLKTNETSFIKRMFLLR